MAGRTKIQERAFRESCTVFDCLERRHKGEEWWEQAKWRIRKTAKQITLDLSLKEAVGYINLSEDSSAINGHNRIGDTSSVIRKLDDGATNDHVDRRGNTALHFAVRFGYIRIVQLILEHHPKEIERKNIHGHTALRIAFETNNYEMYHMLLKKKPENPIYHWLMSQGQSGDVGLACIDKSYELGSVIVNDYKHLKDTGDLNRHDWRFRIAFPKLETFCTSQKGPYFLTNFFKSTLGFRTANIDGDLTSLVNKNGALLSRENFNGEVKLVELLVYFNLMNCHYRFLDEDITFNSFQQLRQDDLERMGFRLGTIRSILAAIYELKTNGANVMQAILRRRVEGICESTSKAENRLV
jgi:hypothetical protein